MLLACFVAGQAAAAGQEGSRAGGEGFDDFGFDFLRAASTGENSVSSPRNLGRLLALAASGARGNTQREILAALRATPAEVERIGEADGACGHREGWAVAIRDGWSFTKSFQRRLDGLGVDRIPFSSNLDETRSAIDRWAGDRTLGRVRDLVPKGGLNGNSTLVLMSVSDFTTRWANEFQPSNTQPKPFRLQSGDRVSVPMMSGRMIARYAILPEVSIIELPFICDGLAAVVLMPPDPKDGTATSGETGLGLSLLVPGGKQAAGPTKKPPPTTAQAFDWSRFERRITKAALAQWRAKLAPAIVHVELPSFEVRSSWQANEPLQKMGIRRAFESGADFMGMTTSPVYLQRAFHQAVLKVDEGGVQASAGSALVFGSRGMPPPVPEFVVDRPFLFLIQDVRSGEVLFLARVVDPRAR